MQKIVFPKAMGEKGAVLVISLVIMVILSLMGAAAILISSQDVRSSRSDRLKKSAFYAADAGVEVAPSIIQYYIQGTPDPAGFPDNLRSDLQGIMQDENFLNEIMGYTTDNDGSTDSPQSNPDVEVTLQGRPISIDIDRFHTEHPGGGSAESLAGYEGVGTGSGAGGTAVYYRAAAQGTEADGTSSNVEIVYRHIY